MKDIFNTMTPMGVLSFKSIKDPATGREYDVSHYGNYGNQVEVSGNGSLIISVKGGSREELEKAMDNLNILDRIILEEGPSVISFCSHDYSDNDYNVSQIDVNRYIVVTDKDEQLQAIDCVIQLIEKTNSTVLFYTRDSHDRSYLKESVDALMSMVEELPQTVGDYFAYNHKS